MSSRSGISGGEYSLRPIGPPNRVHREVYEALRRAITSGDLVPGQRLVEATVASQLGVSRAPLREAIGVLERDGLISRLPRRGMVVSVLSRRDVVEIYDLRTALETWAIAKACEEASAKDVAGLASIVDDMRRAIDFDDMKRVAERDVAFHRALCALSHNKRLVAAWNSNYTQIQILSTQSSAEKKPYVLEFPDRHLVIVHAIAKRKCDAAQRIICEHIQSAARRTLARPEYGDQPGSEGGGSSDLGAIS